mmetsp:Transcript_10914/g.38325  ORF Transcript_10914/g.38325 Transcript_10914/m.38325 type:complete len:207 (+) Transcript_10914:4036-4656(+)
MLPRLRLADGRGTQHAVDAVVEVLASEVAAAMDALGGGDVAPAVGVGQVLLGDLDDEVVLAALQNPHTTLALPLQVQRQHLVGVRLHLPIKLEVAAVLELVPLVVLESSRPRARIRHQRAGRLRPILVERLWQPRGFADLDHLQQEEANCGRGARHRRGEGPRARNRAPAHVDSPDFAKRAMVGCGSPCAHGQPVTHRWRAVGFGA